ncbi:hypothetical protein CEXT_281781 [Caerostris extrusa]|uniref:Uncharacterized protein n=1 Tax=Caerostris extrusa TaxID=172846 RepID=A0AAV4XNI4_CAEEX|nr:hypothetical protein CEXT_281781 [Caerostris extrusa]
MLKVNNRKLEGVPKEARLSLEFLDEVLDQYESEVEQFAENKQRHLEDIPVDVRHSLEILDDILTEYEGDDNSCDIKDENSSTQDLRPMEDIPEAVRKSLEILDSIIDEVEQESQMPRRNRSNVNGTLDRRNRYVHFLFSNNLLLTDSLLQKKEMR